LCVFVPLNYYQRRGTSKRWRFLGKALSGLKDWEKPLKINTDKAPTYAVPADLKKRTGCRGHLPRWCISFSVLEAITASSNN
jgi:hypothetical protein